ncbi:MAG: nucleotidyltransferase family protein [Peptoniphilaceae bacterium]|nr:nucleotidyltransferase family protein [Peptoniphilaceae bacterium]MDY6085578.1 nucleotidyltransferase family protein [Peptoniphilaceae bacterium]
MTTLGIICELNPLHSGHLRLLDFARAHADTVVIAMSGPFVQRGEVAVMDPWTRARQAVRHSADLVLQIPTVYVLQSADYYAKGGVSTLNALGAVDGLAFGVEAEAPVFSPKDVDADSVLREQLQSGLSYRRAAAASLGHTLSPNAILASQYIHAVHNLGLSWVFYPLARPVSSPGDPSATRLRQNLAILAQNGASQKNLTQGASFQKRLFQEEKVPSRASCVHLDGYALQSFEDPAFDALVDKELVAKSYHPAETSAVIQWLQLENRRGTLDFQTSPHFEPGMDRRVSAVLDQWSRESQISHGKLLAKIQDSHAQDHISNHHTLEELVTLCANKRQSKARYRRMIWTTLLGITKADLVPVTYLMPLAFNQKGAALLKRAPSPVIQKKVPNDLSSDAKRLLAVDRRAWAIAQHLTGQSRSPESYRYLVD